jgi:ribosomal-protein-alanine N-acetyltransferase
LQLCRRTDHVETRSPPYFCAIRCQTSVWLRRTHPNCSLAGVDPIVSDRLELVSLSPDFIDALLSERRPQAESLGGFKLPDGWPDRHDAGFLALRLRQMRETPEIREWFVYAIVLPEGERPMVGHAGFHGPPGVNARKAADAVEVGYSIFEPYRRKGYATEAVRRLIEWAASEYGIAHFLASVSPDNEPSLALVRRLGFEEVGSHWDDEDGDELEFALRINGGA